jgi:membrane protein DedA with SNARE-associated domain
MARMNLGVFLLLTTLGTAIWNTVLVFAGAFLGESWEVAAGYINTYTNVFVAICVVAVVALGVWYYKKRIQSKE